MNVLKDTVKKFEDLELAFEDIKILVEFYEAGDESVAEELDSSYVNIKTDLNDFNTELLLDGPYDNLNAIVTVHSGAGGTEALVPLSRFRGREQRHDRFDLWRLITHYTHILLIYFRISIKKISRRQF